MAVHQPTWVLTHRPEIVAPSHPVQPFSGDVTDLHPKLVAAAGFKDIWVVGGGEAAAQFVDAGLVDELVVTYVPCTLGSGGRLLPTVSEWSLAESGDQPRLRLREVAQSDDVKPATGRASGLWERYR